MVWRKALEEFHFNFQWWREVEGRINELPYFSKKEHDVYSADEAFRESVRTVKELLSGGGRWELIWFHCLLRGDAGRSRTRHHSSRSEESGNKGQSEGRVSGQRSVKPVRLLRVRYVSPSEKGLTKFLVDVIVRYGDPLSHSLDTNSRPFSSLSFPREGRHSWTGRDTFRRGPSEVPNLRPVKTCVVGDVRRLVYLTLGLEVRVTFLKGRRWRNHGGIRTY